MNKFSWIMSAGGPLIGMEPRLFDCWGGVFRKTRTIDGIENDYASLFFKMNYIESIVLRRGSAFALGEGPLDTSFWRSPDGQVFIVRIDSCEPEMNDEEFDAIMRVLAHDLFDNPLEVLDFTIGLPELVVFDSAESGSDPDKEKISCFLEPGHYQIKTRSFEPDPTCSLVLHRFDQIV